jgi:hypothetical protein
MADEATNLVLEHLRRVREDIDALRAEMPEETGDLKLRTSALEQSVARGFDGMQSMISQISGVDELVSRRSDRIEIRSDSIETRLDKLEDFSDATERLEERLN